MDGSRFKWLLAVCLVLAFGQTGWSQSYFLYPFESPSQQPTCKVYSLTEFAEDPSLCQWITETIPQVIQPGTWKTAIRYNPKVSVMVVTNTETVHAQVDEFLKNVKKALPAQNGNKAAAQGKTQPTTLPPIVLPGEKNEARGSVFIPGGQIIGAALGSAKALQAESPPPPPPFPGEIGQLLQGLFQQAGAAQSDNTATITLVPQSQAAEAAVNKATAYPIPAPLKQPKHLFHFIIRYEGEGALDSVVSELTKKLSGDTTAKEDNEPKSKAEPGKAAPLNQLLHLIIRYEGDGLIDENVVQFMKAFQKENRAPTVCNSPSEQSKLPTYPVQPAAYSSDPLPPPEVIPASRSPRMPPAEEPRPTIPSALPSPRESR